MDDLSFTWIRLSTSEIRIVLVLTLEDQYCCNSQLRIFLHTFCVTVRSLLAALHNFIWKIRFSLQPEENKSF